MKSLKLLLSFVSYCFSHRGERFWQALRNWSKYEFIYGSNKSIFSDAEVDDLEDTFYFEEKNG